MGTIWARLDAPRHHLKSQVSVVTASCQFGSRLLLGYIQVCPYMDILAVEDMLMDLLGLGVQAQHEGEWDRLTSTFACEKRRKETSTCLASFSGSLWTQLDAIENVRTYHGPMAPQGPGQWGAPWGSRAGQPGASGAAPALGTGTGTGQGSVWPMARMDQVEQGLRVLTQELLDGASALSFALSRAQGAGLAGLTWLC